MEKEVIKSFKSKVKPIEVEEREERRTIIEKLNELPEIEKMSEKEERIRDKDEFRKEYTKYIMKRFKKEKKKEEAIRLGEIKTKKIQYGVNYDNKIETIIKKIDMSIK